MDPIEFLKFGFGGLAAFFAFITYKLLKAEQKIDKPRPSMVKMILRFMYGCALFALLEFSLNIIKPIIYPVDIYKIKKCSDRIEEVKTKSQIENTTLADLRHFIDAMETQCKDIGEK